MPLLLGILDKQSSPMASKGALRRVAALALVPLAFAGCGGSKSKSAEQSQPESAKASKADSAEVIAVVHRYYAALASGNGSEYCSLLTDATKERLLRQIQAASRSQGNLTCPQVVKVLRRGIRQDQITALKQAKAAVVSLSGDNATVSATLSIGGQSRATVVTLSRTAAGWLIGKLPGS
jgi:hypothetical protein